MSVVNYAHERIHNDVIDALYGWTFGSAVSASLLRQTCLGKANTGRYRRMTCQSTKGFRRVGFGIGLGSLVRTIVGRTSGHEQCSQGS